MEAVAGALPSEPALLPAPGQVASPARRIRRPAGLAVACALVAALAGCAVGGADEVERTREGVRLGPWGFRADPRDEGSGAGWARTPPRTERVTIPHVVATGPVGGPAGERLHRGGVGWYRTTVTADRAGTYGLRFGSASGRATVWLDGRRACGHAGAYVPFTCPLRLREGRRHQVVVRLDWRLPASGPGARRGWFNWGGLAWPVRIARLGRSTLADPGIVTRLMRGGRVRVDVRVTVRNRSRRARTIRPHGRLGRATLRFAARRVGAGATATLRARAGLTRPRLWSPERPVLHDLDIEVPGESHLGRRVGLRELRWDGGTLRLNGRVLRLVGASLPPDAEGRGDALRPDDHARIVRRLRDVGANATRAQFPLEEGLLRRLDEAGILVWQQLGPWEPAGAFAAATPRARSRATRDALATAARQAAHPSVVTWSLGNEVAGQGERSGQAAYVDALARALHRLDPGRPVAVEVWGLRPPLFEGPLYRDVDVLGLTDYSGWYELAVRPAAEQEALTRARVAALQAGVPGRPVVITELGAGADPRNPSTAPGGEGYQAALVRRRLRTLADLPGVQGALVFTLRDYAYRPGFAGRPPREVVPAPRFPLGLNAKGLFRFDDSPRPAAKAAREGFAAFARR